MSEDVNEKHIHGLKMDAGVMLSKSPVSTETATALALLAIAEELGAIRRHLTQPAKTTRK